jgi:hypothetical protein
VLVLRDAQPPKVSAGDRDNGCAEGDGTEHSHRPDLPSVDTLPITVSAFRSPLSARLEPSKA